MKNSRFFAAAAFLSMGLGAQSAWAATEPGTLTATASITNDCTIGDATMAFGAYNSLTQAAVDGTTTAAVQCTSGAAYKIYSTTALADRKMVTGDGLAGKVLSYKLYTSSARTTELGTDATIATIDGTGTGSSVNIDLYGTVDASQTAIAGSYSGTANLTVSF